jgi:hypothetical protein
MSMACAATAPPAPRVVDIATADGVVLKGTLFAAAKRGPAVRADAITGWFAAMLADRPGAAPATNGVPLAPAILEELHAIDRPGGAAAALARRADAAAGTSAGPLVPEYFVNQLGYEHMIMKDYPTAIDLMKLNAAFYPASPNTMDSLGDVYLAAGDIASALAAAKQTLVLLDRDTVDTAPRKADLRRSAEDKITRLSTR